MITDKCADLSAHMDMIKSKMPFLCLQRIKYWLLTALGEGFGVVSIISIMYVPMHLHTHVGNDRSSFFFDYCGANFNRKHS
jgi:hypothetical protein